MMVAPGVHTEKQDSELELLTKLLTVYFPCEMSRMSPGHLRKKTLVSKSGSGRLNGIACSRDMKDMRLREKLQTLKRNF